MNLKLGFDTEKAVKIEIKKNKKIFFLKRSLNKRRHNVDITSDLFMYFLVENGTFSRRLSDVIIPTQ